MLHHGKPTNSYKALLATLVAAAVMWIASNVVQAQQAPARPHVPRYNPIVERKSIDMGSGQMDVRYDRMVDLSTGVACYSRLGDSNISCVKLTAPLK